MATADDISTSAPFLEALNVTKRFGNVRALRGVNLTVRPAEIMALIGDNGAGKSTLVKILAGVLSADSGEIRVGGHPVAFGSPVDARRHGIETVYQDLALCDDLNPIANLFLGRETMRTGVLGRLGFLDNKSMQVRGAREFEQLHVNLPSLRSPVATFSGGQRQGVAVGRAAMWAEKVIILDEPTAALGVRQTARVLNLIGRVRDAGLSIILVSHNMPDVLEVADRVAVLRLGRQVAQFDRADATVEKLVTAMTSGEA
jgi:simple sugar transport system ATP-binding protein